MYSELRNLGQKNRYAVVLEITMTTCRLLLLMVLVIASSYGQTTTDDDVSNNVEIKNSSMQDMHLQLLQTLSSRLSKHSGTNSNFDNRFQKMTLLPNC